jgi:predicted nucleic acid-binding protein
MKKKLYIETSVWNQLVHDDRPDWRETTENFLMTLKRGIYEPFISTVVIDEVMATKDESIRMKLIGFINEVEPTSLEFDEEAQILTSKYLEKEFKNNRSKGIYNDSSHVAIATVNNIHHIISFNCHHLVNDRRIDGFNGINFQNGYDIIIDITTPDRFILPDDIGDTL